jgi:hypothetical protein
MAYVPDALKTEDICREALRGRRREIMRFKKFFYYSVENEDAPCPLAYVPQAFITAELCAEAVHNDIKSIAYVPENLLTEEIFLAAVKNHNCGLQYAT